MCKLLFLFFLNFVMILGEGLLLFYFFENFYYVLVIIDLLR